MATVLTGIITPALAEIGVVAEGETPPSGTSSLALSTLNRLLDQWPAERDQLFTVTRTTWTITTQDGEYTVGSGADVNIARPVSVESVGFIDTSTDPDTEYPLRELTEKAYRAIPQKLIESPYPQAWYYNPTYANATLTFWPVPTSSTLQGVLYARATISYPTTLSTTVSFPPGYEELLVTTLAVRLAAPFGRPVDPDLRMRAQEAKRIVERANLRLSDLSFDGGALIGSPDYWNVRTGQ